MTAKEMVKRILALPEEQQNLPVKYYDEYYWKDVEAISLEDKWDGHEPFIAIDR